MNTDKVTRFEVINHTGWAGEKQGRVLVKHGVSIELSLQDEGRTLKVFVTDGKKEDEDGIRD